MNSVLKKSIGLFFLLLCCQINAQSDNIGHITGTLILDDSWDSIIYVSFIETFEKEYAVSNDLIVTSAEVDSLGNFKIELSKIPVKWSFLRLHMVKKGVSPNSLVIGSMDENYFFLIAKRNSEINLYNTAGNPIFKNLNIEGTTYMHTYDYIRQLSNYPNSMDYENSLIEKEFIKEVVSEKLKAIADTCLNPLVSLYALYQADFQSDYVKDTTFYNSYLLKWKNEKNSYFDTFRLRFPDKKTATSPTSFSRYYLLFIGIGTIILINIFIVRNRPKKTKNLSVQERKIFELIRQGMSNKEICAECNIELTTVKSHVSSIYSKLKIKSRKEVHNLKWK